MLLQYDLIYAQFNLRDARMVNGRYLTRYRHLLPANYNARALTFTNEPYTAREILEFCFRAATVESPWWPDRSKAASCGRANLWACRVSAPCNGPACGWRACSV